MTEPPDGCPAILISGYEFIELFMLILLNSAPSCCVPLLIKHAERGMLKEIILLPADPPGGHYVIPTWLTQWRGFTITTPLGQQGATLLIAWL